MAPSSPAAAEPSPTATVTATAEGQRSLPTPFLSKTYQLVEDSEVDDVISWNSDGLAFVVWKPAEFARDLLPKCFKHNNFSSFVRQLNTYGFRKIVPDRWEFANDCFKRGERRLLCDIHRRKITSPVPPPPPPPSQVTVAAVALNMEESAANSGEEQVLSSNSSPTAATEAAPPDLAADNERLRMENLRLSRELGQMKNLCDNIYVLISKYSGGGAAAAAEVVTPPSAEMELFPAGSSADTSLNPKLFGFAIRTKRVREEEDPTGEVKLEPDTWTGPKDDGSGPGSWALYCSRPDLGTCNR